MDSKRGNISIFAILIISLVAIGLGTQMLSNFSVFQMSKSYHVVRERLLVQKMLFQSIEEVALSQYELTTDHAALDFDQTLAQETQSIKKKTGLNISDLVITKNTLKKSSYGIKDGTIFFEKGYKGLNVRLSRYLNLGPYVDLGSLSMSCLAEVAYYPMLLIAYGIPLSNFNFTFYDLPTSRPGLTQENVFLSKPDAFGFRKNNIFVKDSKGCHLILDKEKSDIAYKNRMEVSLFCNAFEWLWTGDFLNQLIGESQKSFVLNIPFYGEIKEPGISLDSQKNKLTLDLGKLNLSLLTIADPTGLLEIDFQESKLESSPLKLVIFNNASSAKKTRVKIEKSLKRTLITYALNSEIQFSGSPHLKGSFFLDPNSVATGKVVLDGSIACYAGAPLNASLDVQFARTDPTTLQLAKLTPHAFVTELQMEDRS